MGNYPQRVADNILPLSLSGTLPEAFKEWYFTENVVDHEKAEEVCGLCDHEQIRYHFQIKNRHTDKELWVGSSCILKFQVQVFEGDQLLKTKDARKKLDKLTKKMRLESCIKSLEKLADEENNEILKSALKYYKKNKFLTPKFAFVVLWRLKENEIDYNPAFFKISLKRNKYKNDLKNMNEFKAKLLWPALTSNQREIAKRYGHKKP